MDFRRNKLSRMSRRRLIKNLSVMGLGAATLANITPEVYAEQAEDDDHIVYKSGWRNTDDGQKATYESIPRQEWDRNTATANAAESIEQDLHDMGLTPETSRASMTHLGSGRSRKLGVSVSVVTTHFGDGRTVRPSKSEQEVRDQLPDTVEAKSGRNGKGREVRNIPVRVRSSEQEFTSCFDELYSPVPGGCRIRDDTKGETQTLCAPFRRDNGTLGWTTAAHGVGGGNDIYQPYTGSPSQVIGQVSGQNTYAYSDVAFIDGDKSTIGNMAGDSDCNTATHDLVGVKNNTFLQNNIGADGGYQGTVSGFCFGEITDYISHALSNDDVQVNGFCGGPADGDSGGTMYYYDGDYYLIGATKAYYNGDAVGNTMESMKKSFNGSFVL